MASDIPMDPFDCAFEAARQGDAYLAVEKAGVVIRKLKRQKKSNEAFLGALRLADFLLDKEQWQAASQAAARAPEALAPGDALTEDQNGAVLKFLERDRPECGSASLWGLCNDVIARTGDPQCWIRGREAEMADKSESWTVAQRTYVHLVHEKIEKEMPVDEDIEKLADLLWRWIATIEDEEQRVFTSQFILARVVLAILAKRGEQRVAVVNAAKQMFVVGKRDCNEPLMLFLKVVLVAIENGDQNEFKQACECFVKLTAKDSELCKWIARVQERNFGSGGAGGIGQIVRNMLSMFTGSPAPA